MLIIEIEGRNNVIPDVGAQFNESLDEGVSNGSFVWHTHEDGEPIKPFTKCTVNLDGEVSYWYASSAVDIPITVPQRLYKHTVSLINPLFALQGFPMPNRAFTQPMQAELSFLRQTYWDVLENIRQTVPLDTDDNVASSRVFRLDPALASNPVFKELAPANFPTAKNLHEFIVNVGRSIGAVPQMIGYDILTFVFLDDTNQESLEDADWITRTGSVSTEDYCSQLEADALNILDDNNDSAMVYPYPGGWIGVRTDGSDSVIKADEGTSFVFIQSLDRTDNSVIELPYPVYKITKLLGSVDGGTNAVDITSKVVTKKAYDALSNFDKGRRIYYEHGSKLIRGIGFLYQANAYPAIVNAMNAAGSISGGSTSIVRRLLFRVEYIPLMPDTVKARAAKDAYGMRHEHTWITSQQDNIVSASSFGKYMENTADRVGQPLLRFFKPFPRDGKFNLPKLGSYLEPDWFLSSRSFTVLRQNITAELTFSKDFNIIGGPVSLDSEPRYYEISAEGNTLIRRDYMSEYCVIGLPCDNKRGNFDSAGSRFMSVFNNAAQDIEIATVNAITKNANKNQIKNIILQCDSKAFGNSLLFSFSFPDNFSAGTRCEDITKRDSIIDVPYTESFDQIAENLNSGQFEYVTAAFGRYPDVNDLSIEQIMQHAALLPENDRPYSGYWTLSNIFYKKDNREVPALNFQIHMVVNDKRYVVGRELSERNPLIVKTASKTLQVRYLTQKVKKHRNGNISQISVPSGLAFSMLNNRIIQVNGTFDQQYAGYAITDSAGNLYIAFNDKSFAPIEFSFVKTIYER